MFQLTPIDTWWIILHMLLIPLFALMGWAFFLLLQGIENRAATVSRYAAVVYTSFAIGFDAAVGLASGVLVSSAVSLPAAQQALIQGVLSQLYESPAIVLSYYILFGAGIVAVVAAALALASQGVPRLPLILLWAQSSPHTPMPSPSDHWEAPASFSQLSGSN